MEADYYVLPLAIRDVLKSRIEQGIPLKAILYNHEMLPVLNVLGTTNYLGDLQAINETNKSLRKLKQLSSLDAKSALIKIIELELPPEMVFICLNVRSSKNLTYWIEFLKDVKETLQKNKYDWWVESAQKYNILAKVKLLQSWTNRYFNQMPQIDRVTVMPTSFVVGSSTNQQKRIERILHSEENFIDTVLGGSASVLRDQSSRILSVRLPTWIHQISDLNECQLLGILGHELSHLFFSGVSSLMCENKPCVFGSWAGTQEILASYLSLCLLEKAGRSDCCKIFLNLEKKIKRGATSEIWPLRKTILPPQYLLKLIQEKLGGKTYPIHRLEKQLSSLKTRNNKSLKGLLKHLGVEKKGIQLDGMKRSQLTRLAKRKIGFKLEVATMEMEQGIREFCSELKARIQSS